MVSSTLFWTEFLKLAAEQPKNPSVLLSLLKQVRPIALKDSLLVLGCSNQGLKFFLDKRAKEIEEIIYQTTRKKLLVNFVLIEKKETGPPPPLFDYQPSVSDRLSAAGLLIKYSFDNFAVSSTNQVAYAAAQAVVNNLGSAYNPLFIYGGVGVGKTHLAQAIARKIIEEKSEKKVFFCPGDLFTNELIESIRERATSKFRRKYRRLDLLVVDDVQFIAGKQTVQEEFFHTFNSIISAGGQIVLISDRPPIEIKGLEDRLRSRFSGGLTVDIQPPDFELRTAIVLIKAKEKKIEIDIDAARIIAERIEDTRALEGTLLSVYAKTLGKKEKIDLETIASFFNNQEQQQRKKTSPEEIIRAICSFYNLKTIHLKGPSREKNLVLPRQLSMYILRNVLKLRLEDVASYLRRKDHTTVLHAVDKISRLLAKDPLFKKEVDQILASLDLST
ncbi:MAG: chromosomal replication initiator protein DnaA [Microgenomates group bacterium]|nr:chromosomal replication initiator protein DnaA [Microgenomates group bacterium]